MKSQKILMIFVVFALLFSAGCSSQKPEAIKIGVIAPLTGNAAELGEHVTRGLTLANNQLDHTYELIYEDSKCFDTKASLSAAQKLTDIDDVSFVIGPLCAPAYQATAGKFNQENVVFMHTSGVTPPFIASAGDYGIPGITTTIHLEDAFLADYIYNELGLRKIAVFVWNEEWAVEHRNGFVKRFESLGGNIVFDETFTLDDNDFRTSALKIKQSNAEGVFIVALNFQNANIVKQFKQMNLAIPVFGQFEVEDTAFLEPAGEAAEGVTYVYPHIDKTHKETAKFVNDYKELYGSEPNYYAYIGYDSLKLYDHAIQTCKGINTDCVVQEIRSAVNFPGVSGLMTLHQDGTIVRDFDIKTIRNGQFVTL